MRSTPESMKLGEEILALIDRRRTETGDPSLGSAIERLLLDTQVREIEEEIFENPGAIEPWLLKRRKDN